MRSNNAITPGRRAARRADGRRNTRRTTAPDASIRLNFTAMIDVVFLLLVYFVVTASFSADEGVLKSIWRDGIGPVEPQVLLPKTPIDVEVIAYDEAGYRLRVGGGGVYTPTDFDELATLLAGWRGGLFEGDNPVVIRPVGKVRWTHVLNAFNAAVRARYTDITFAQARPEA